MADTRLLVVRLRSRYIRRAGGAYMAGEVVGLPVDEAGPLLTRGVAELYEPNRGREGTERRAYGAPPADRMMRNAPRSKQGE